MKRLLIMLAAMLPLFAFVGCSDEEDSQKEIKNLSGTNWYEAQVWFLESEDPDSMTSYVEVGDVENGESCFVNSDQNYFYIYAKDGRGRLIMSQPQPLLGSNLVSESDLF